MQSIPTQCPLCGGEITVTRLHCRDCDSTIEGRFSGGPFSQLSPEQLKFVEIFVRLEGKIKHMEEEIGLSYPTIRNRLHEIIRALGYQPGPADDFDSPTSSGGLSSEERQRILEDLDKGLIGAEEAMRLLEMKEE
jgi:hypothetical protein